MKAHRLPVRMALAAGMVLAGFALGPRPAYAQG
jgi:hypothetical protein